VLRPTSSPLVRRALLVAGVSLTSLVAASCGTFTENTTAISVNGSDLSVETLEDYVKQFDKIQQIPIADGVVELEGVRGLLGAFVRENVYTRFLDSYGTPLTDEQVQAKREEIGDDVFSELTPELAEMIIRLNAGATAIQEFKAPSDEDIEKTYKAEPSLTGALCVNHIVTKTKAKAAKVLAKLDAGADWKTLAGQYSLEDNAGETGGALFGEGPDGKAIPCQSILQFQDTFDPLFVAGVLEAEAGVPYGPVRSSFGYHVIYVQPFDEVKDTVLELVKSQPGPLMATGLVSNTEVLVDPAYGVWSPAVGAIVAN
jgi:foldase protein PrsA